MFYRHMDIYSVTKWLYYLFKIWPFTAMKSCPIAKSAQNFDKYLINPQTNAQKSFNFCRSGKILSNLVTLDTCLITCIGSVSEPRLTELLKLSSLPNLSKKKIGIRQIETDETDREKLFSAQNLIKTTTRRLWWWSFVSFSRIGKRFTRVWNYI